MDFTVLESPSWAGHSVIVDHDSCDPCVLCGEGPYREAEYHLHCACACGNVWYHPACTVKLLRYVYGAYIYVPLVCKYCTGQTMKYYKDCAIVKESVEEEDVFGEDVFGAPFFEKGERRNRKKKKTVQHRVNHKGKTNLFSKNVT